MLYQGTARKVHLLCFLLNYSAEEEEGLEEEAKAHGMESWHSAVSLRCCAVPADS